MSIPPATTDRIVAVIRDRIPDVRFAYVFGSAARGQLRPDSDLDIAVAASQPLQGTQILMLSGELEGVVRRRVDVVDLHRAGPILAMKVLTEGTVIMQEDRRALDEFQMYTPTMYEDWKHLRRPIDEALLRRLSS